MRKMILKIRPLVLGGLAATISWCLAKGDASQAEIVSLVLVAALVSIEVIL